jgi:rod shape-determining protein MreC
MESFFSRYRNLVVLLAALVLQVIGLAVQVRKPAAGAPISANSHETHDAKGVRLIRLWASDLVTPFERIIHGSREGATGFWGNYLDLRHTREENKQLQQTIDRLRLEQASLLEDARQGQRLQGLLNFRQSYIYDTVPAQVIGTSGSMQSRVIVLDKGADAGLKPDMAVITPDGIVGKVRDVFPHAAQVLVINDQTSGAGVILETTRIRGILRGNAAGQPQVINILADQRIQAGEKVLTAGGDQIFPRGLPVGVVEKVERDPDRGSFINVIIKPAANLQHLDEVLVITSLDAHLSPQQMADLKTSEELKGAEVAADAERKKAAAEMAERLPSLTDPNAPVDPNAKPATVPATPKPAPALHPDRFSPGGAVSAGGAGTETGNGDGVDGDVKLVAPRAVEPKTAPKKPQTANPNTAKPPVKKPPTAGRVQ